MFQYFYWISANGTTLDLDPDFSNPTDRANHAWLTDFMARIPVGLLGGKDGKSYCFTKAVPYQIQISDKLVPNYAWTPATDLYPDWPTVYRKNYGNTPCGNWLEDHPEQAAGGYWGLILSALACAVDRNVEGAREAYARLKAANNWDVIQKAGFDDFPNYAIVPRDSKER